MKYEDFVTDKLVEYDGSFARIQNIINGSQILEEVKPIPLTEEWLYKLSGGCIIEKICENTITVDRFRLIWKPKYSYWYIVDDVHLTYITKAEYVHEWQGIYHALNGTQLVLTSDKKP